MGIMKEKGDYISEQECRFYYTELETAAVFQRENREEQDCLLFFLSGEVEVIYSGSRPRVVNAGNMIFLGRLTDCVVVAREPTACVVLVIDEVIDVCVHFTFQSLIPIASLLKYDFKELDMRRPLWLYLELLQIYLKDSISGRSLFQEKLKELIILFRGYYSTEELAMFFYPIIGKSMDFRNTVLDNYLKANSLADLAELCGYGLVAFQRKFKDVFGETAYQWIQRQKAEHIRHRLMTEDINLKELSEEFDFASMVHLNKFCKTWFGMTPSELRETLILKRNLK